MQRALSAILTITRDREKPAVDRTAFPHIQHPSIALCALEAKLSVPTYSAENHTKDTL